MRSWTIAGTLLLLWAMPALAGPAVRLTGGLSWISTSADDSLHGAPAAGHAEIEIDDSTGGFLALNVFWSDQWSTELAASIAEPDIITTRFQDGEAVLLNDGGLKIIPVTLTFQYHFTPDHKVSPFIGLGGAWVVFDDLNTETDFSDISLSNVDFQQSVGLVVDVGADVSLSDRWSIYLDGKYVPLDSSAYAVFNSTSAGNTRASVNPLIISTGISYRF